MNSDTKITQVMPGIYTHYKGQNYQVLDTVTHSETLERMVLYKPLYGEQALWVRPAEMFHQRVEVAGQLIPRFSLLESHD